MTRPTLERVVARVRDVLPTAAVVKVGVEAAGHYHLPMITGSAWPTGWEVLEGPSGRYQDGDEESAAGAA